MIVIPMAGQSARFSSAGYQQPKYMLRAHGKSLFEYAVSSFSAYLATERFLFIVRNVADTLNFVRTQAQGMGVRTGAVTVLRNPTRGQAETVALGIDQVEVRDDEPLTIFNIDTFRPGYRFPDVVGSGIDGYLEVFVGKGNNWSYVRPLPGGRVAETAEKRPISDLCCTGLYHFASAGLFRKAYQRAEASFVPGAGTGERPTELYVAPMYNELISEGRDIRYHVIPRGDVIFCGVPEEYEAFLASDDWFRMDFAPGTVH